MISTLDITTSYLIDDTRPEADSMVEVKLYEGLKTIFLPVLLITRFDSNFKVGSKKVLPTISDDLKGWGEKSNHLCAV